MNSFAVKIKKSIENPQTIRILFWVLFLVGILARVWRFGAVPADINQDEAFGGYEAYALLHYGVDTSGYSFPVYLTVWGSGMSALNSYLMIPFIALFGLKTWVIRLPQLIVGCLTLPASYLLVKKLSGAKAALCALLLVAICPWHILMSRWGLDCNLAPGFLIFALCFFVYGLENSRYFMLSALMYGLSLYCYATIWPFVPMILLLQFAYGFYYKKIRFDRNLFFSVIILGILALPLLLFVAVNLGLIAEIRLPFLSIPRLLYMRSGEFSFSQLIPNATNLLKILWHQSDGLIWNTAGKYGFYYKCSVPFMVLGLIYCIRKLISGFRKKEFCGESFLLIHLLAGGILGVTLHVNANRDNILFMSLIFLTATGVCWAGSFFRPYIGLVICLLYLVQFGQFERYYFTDYRAEVSSSFTYGLEEAMETALSRDGRIYIGSGIHYPKVLFYSQQPTDEFLETVKYKNYPSAFLKTKSFGRFRFGYNPEKLKKKATYILNTASDDLTPFENAGYLLQPCGNFTVAYKK